MVVLAGVVFCLFILAERHTLMSSIHLKKKGKLIKDWGGSPGKKVKKRKVCVWCYQLDWVGIRGILCGASRGQILLSHALNFKPFIVV